MRKSAMASLESLDGVAYSTLQQGHGQSQPTKRAGHQANPQKTHVHESSTQGHTIQCYQLPKAHIISDSKDTLSTSPGPRHQRPQGQVINYLKAKLSTTSRPRYQRPQGHVINDTETSLLTTPEPCYPRPRGPDFYIFIFMFIIIF